MHSSIQDSESVTASRRFARCGLLRSNYFFAAMLLAAFASSSLAQMTNGVLREIYLGITGSSLSSLTNNGSFPNSPSTNEIMVGLWEGPGNYGDNYGDRY